jgi:hypothetical protein
LASLQWRRSFEAVVDYYSKQYCRGIEGNQVEKKRNHLNQELAYFPVQMADFVEDEIIDKNVEEEEEVDSEEDEKDVKGKASKSGKKSERKSDAEEPFDFTKPRKVTYCPTCSLPPEYCEYGQTFEKCLPWILENCPEAVSEDILSKMMGEVSIEGEEVRNLLLKDLF